MRTIPSGKSECVLCGRFEDENNIQEQMGYQLCLQCDCTYTDEELLDKLDYQNKLTWEDYYQYLDIPDEWENVSYGNDESPSFSHNGYQIWINHPTLEGRQQAYLGIGYKDLSEFEDWKFAVCYTRDYGNLLDKCKYIKRESFPDENADSHGCEQLMTMYFNEVVDFVNKPSLYGLVGVLEEQFNYKIDFAEMRENELIKFIKDLLNGNTEYCNDYPDIIYESLDNKFPRQTFINFINNIGEK